MAEERKQIDPQDCWDLTAIIQNDDEFDGYLSELDTLMQTLNGYQRAVTEDNALDLLALQSEISAIYEKLYVFTHMKSDEDKRDSASLARASKIEMLGVKISEASSFLQPGLSKLSLNALTALQNAPDAKRFDRFLSLLIEEKPHILSEKEEQLLAEASSFTSDFKNIFMMFDNADIKFDPVTMPDGTVVELTHGSYSLLLQNQDRAVRAAAFKNVYKTYREHINTISAVYYGLVKKNVFQAKIRNYPSALAKALFRERVPSEVYEKLVSSIHCGTPLLHRYVELRKSVLKELNMYDLYLPLAEGEGLSLSFEDAYRAVTEGLEPLGSEYKALLVRAKSERWIDVYENKGKRSGAYSWGEYQSHPYVLLNHQKTPHDVFTIAHELGHAMHSYYANVTQCYEKAGYEIFVAEVASTVNEVLLLKHLLKTAEGEERKFLLAYYLDMFRTTMFRQTMFAEFERFSHETVEAGEPLTPELLSNEYYRLNQMYYGEAVTHNDDIRYEWARIPHFYNAFYVYKYATGIISAVTIASKILKEGDAYVEKYCNMLKAGGSLNPVDILKIAEVELDTDEPYTRAMSEFSAALEELEKLC